MSAVARVRALGLVALLAGACASRQPGTGPAPPSGLAATSAASPAFATDRDPGAEADFRHAVRRFGADDRQPARLALEGFVARHPKSRMTPTAAALLGRLALRRGDPAAAKAAIESGAPGSGDPAVSFVLGLAESRLGRSERALALLRPFETGGPPSMAGTVDDEAHLQLRAALAESSAAIGDLARALARWDEYYRHAGAGPHEKAYARDRLDDLARRVDPAVADDVVRRSESPLLRSLLAEKAAVALRARGEQGAAHRLEESAVKTRLTFGFESAAPPAQPGDPLRIGLAAPQSGRLRLLGEVAVRNALLAVAEPLRASLPPYQILVRDAAAADSPGAGTAAADLVRAESVIAIVAVGGRSAMGEAAREGVPYVTLDEPAPDARSTAFHLVHDAEARARALCRRAFAAGARRFALLAPATPAGARLADAFRRAVLGSGDRAAVVGSFTYPAGASAFGAIVEEVRKSGAEAVFVADDSDRLELLAPAFAVADLWPAPLDKTRRRAPTGARRREILLLSTARGLSQRLVKNAGRYVQGALLAPGFFAATNRAPSAAFVAGFRAAFGQDPSATDAYSHDAIWLLRTAIEGGATTRPALMRALLDRTFDGLTGPIRFGPERARQDDALVYTVDGDEIRAL